MQDQERVVGCSIPRVLRKAVSLEQPAASGGGGFEALVGLWAMWAALLPSGTILCADSFLGLQERTCDLAAERHTFLMMTKRSTYGVDKAGELLAEAQTATCTVDDARYAMVVFKNPKVGHKPPRVVPMLMNVHFPQSRPVHRHSGTEVNPVVAATASYRVGWMASTRWHSRCARWNVT